MKAKNPDTSALSVPQGPVPVRPLDELTIPPDLDGRNGVNRADPARLQITADTDADAIRCFLTEYDRSPGGADARIVVTAYVDASDSADIIVSDCSVTSPCTAVITGMLPSMRRGRRSTG